MRLIWEHGPCTADDVRERLASTRPLKDSTVRTILRRLIEKRYVIHSVTGRTYLYAAVIQPEKAAAQAVRRIIDRFCGGSVEQFMVGLVDSDVVGEKELKAIAAKIAQAKGGRK